MHKQLPIALLFFFTLAGFFTLVKLSFAYQGNKPSNHKVIAKIKPSPTTTPKTTRNPTQNPTPIPTRPISPTPTFTPTPAPTSDVSSYLINEVNKYRASQGLSPVQTNDQTCSFAATRAQEIATSFGHDGFTSRLNSKTLPYTTWSRVTENIAMTSDYQHVVPMWINSAGHAANMRADTPFVCIIQNGSYYAYEGMKP